MTMFCPRWSLNKGKNNNSHVLLGHMQWFVITNGFCLLVIMNTHEFYAVKPFLTAT